MIPLNKPLIFSSESTEETPEEYHGSLFPDHNIIYTFSARQGLNLIYKKLYKKLGRLNVAVSPFTCFEALFPILNNGHLITFVDIDAETFNMNESLITGDADVIQAIHLGGNPQDMEIISTVVKKNKQILIEDCAQSLFAFYENKLTGSFGEYSVFSLPKNIYSIAGGMVLSKSSIHAEPGKKMGMLSTGYRFLKRTMESKMGQNQTVIDWLHRLLINMKSENIKTLHDDLSINKMVYRTILNQSIYMYKIQELRKSNALYIINNLNNRNIAVQKSVLNAEKNFNRLYFRSLVREAKSIIEDLRKLGIGANHLTQNSKSFYQPDVFSVDIFNSIANKNNLRNYSRLHDKIFCIPVSPALRLKELDYILFYLNRI